MLTIEGLQMEEAFRLAVEKLNSDVRNYLTPVLAYADQMSSTASKAERKKLAIISQCAHNILKALEEFVQVVTRLPETPER